MINIKLLTNNLKAVHNGLLSKSNSVTPQRHGGFFMSKIRPDFGQTMICRVYIPKYKTRKGNMGSGTIAPRVKPDTLTISTVKVFLNQAIGI